MSSETVRSVYLLPTTSTDTGILDVGQTLSRTNHRLYRQGRNYCLRINVDPDSSRTYEIYALRDDWMMHNAWKKSYETFLNNHKEEMKVLTENGGKARWFDYRINDAITVGVEIQPVRFNIATTGVVTPGPIPVGDFNYTELYAEDGTTRQLNLQSTIAGVSYGILHEYDKMGITNPNPTSATTVAAYGEVDNDLQDASVEQLSGDGNSPPYSSTGLDYTRPWLKIATIGSSGGVQKLSTGYFNAPCGLIVIKPSVNMSSTDPELSMELKSGNYKGVHAPTMGTARLIKDTYEVK